MTAWAVGQQVILRERSYRGTGSETEVTVSRVGRKYVYIEWHGREVGFDAADGIEKGDGNYLDRIFTPEGLVEFERRNAIAVRFGEATSGYGWHRRLNADEMEQIATIVEAANARARGKS